MVYALSGKLGIDFSTPTTTRDFALGTEVEGSDGNTYRYVQANGALDIGALCAIAETGEISEATTTTSGVVPTQYAFPQVAFADDEYGWAVTRGENFLVLAAASCAADVKLYTSATAGVVDDSSTSHDLLDGLRLNTAVGGSADAVSATAINGVASNTA